jgi:hypothetical protein
MAPHFHKFKSPLYDKTASSRYYLQYEKTRIVTLEAYIFKRATLQQFGFDRSHIANLSDRFAAFVGMAEEGGSRPGNSLLCIVFI